MAAVVCPIVWEGRGAMHELGVKLTHTGASCRVDTH